MRAAQTSFVEPGFRPTKSNGEQDLGAVYTPAPLALWTAQLLLERLPKAAEIWDFACGPGALLEAIERAAPGRHRLVGMDVDELAVADARKRVPRADLRITDAVATLPGTSAADGVILNPPWGIQLAQSAPDLRVAGYQLATGQFDSYDIFVELALGLLRPGGAAAFILPDSLFLPEHTPLRRLLVERTSLHAIARLGEGFFKNVYRGTVVLTLEKRRPPVGHAVRCIRLPRHDRSLVLSGKTDLATAAGRRAHEVPQRRFAASPRARFDIDLRDGDHAVLDQIEGAPRLRWRHWFKSGRGTELSKRGLVVHCPQCETAFPQPRRPRLISCLTCGDRFMSASRPVTAIVDSFEHQRLPRGWAPLIVGEDVDRYACAPTRMIRMDVAGVSYKDPKLLARRKLLVRKTGVGLRGAIDETGALTTQVVFHYVEDDEAEPPEFLVDYVLGVFNSRLMLAFHLQTSGDNEWRSHPYVTQSIIEALPIMEVSPGTWQWRQARAIASAVRRAEGRPKQEEDLRIEDLVCGLYELPEAGCSWIADVLDRAQALAGIEPLRVPANRPIRPQRVS